MAARQNAAEAYLAGEIRKKKLLIRNLRRQEGDPDEILVRIAEMEELEEKYNNLTEGKAYAEKPEDIANDFCDELFYELAKPDRDDVKLSRFYDLDAIMNVVGYCQFVGKLTIVNSILDKFRDLKIEQSIHSITLDAGRSKGGIISFDCVSFLKINDDKPRKILQMLELVKSTIPSTYPYVIKREYFVVQDARPLYHWPEKEIVPTKHDNWEPQFKPKVVERPKSATVAVVQEVVAATAENDEDEDGEEGEEEGEVDEAADGAVDHGEAAAADEAGGDEPVADEPPNAEEPAAEEGELLAQAEGAEIGEAAFDD